MTITRTNPAGWIALIWSCLHSYRENGIPEGVPEHDVEWDEITTAMAWISEDLTGPEHMHWNPDSHWDDNPIWPVADWVTAASNGDTRQSYTSWVNTQIELHKEPVI